MYHQKEVKWLRRALAHSVRFCSTPYVDIWYKIVCKQKRQNRKHTVKDAENLTFKCKSSELVEPKPLVRVIVLASDCMCIRKRLFESIKMNYLNYTLVKSKNRVSSCY